MTPSSGNTGAGPRAGATGFTPREIVSELDRYIVGQRDAKRAVAIALRNRWRRMRVDDPLRREITPKNILLMGPTGCGKTEIARRLARLAQAPFVKVEATKFTEVGYVGRDVDSMVRDLVETAVQMVRDEALADVRERSAELATERILDALLPRAPVRGLSAGPVAVEDDRSREKMRQMLLSGALDDREIEIEMTPPPAGTPLQMIGAPGMELSGDMANGLQDMLAQAFGQKKKKRKVRVKDARDVLAVDEGQKLIDAEAVKTEALRRAQEDGIIFIDEIDKIAGGGRGGGPDVSREGVQRDILPIIEGAAVTTKHGPVRTDHMLFICAGAFHMSKPSDLIPELQGRLPIRVELQALTEADFVNILASTEASLTRQVQALMATEGVTVTFGDDGLRAIARIAVAVNKSQENIGARRLATLLERLLEPESFDAPEKRGQAVHVDERLVTERLSPLEKREDLARYIL